MMYIMHCDIRLHKNKPVPNHFNSNNHNMEHVTIFGIDHIQSNNNNTRAARELAWIFELRTINPLGLNVKDA